MTDNISLLHVPTKHRYEIRIDGSTIGFVRYRLPADGRHVDVIHTEVDEAYTGRGLASRLVAFAVSDIVASGKRIIPHCPYVTAWIKRHPEYGESTDWPKGR